MKEKIKNVDLGKVKEKSQGFWNEFKEFAIKGNAIDLAIGMVVGAAFTSIVNSIVNDLITPLIGWALGGLDFSSWFLALDGNKYATLAEAQAAGAVLTYGNLITAVINFLIVAMVIFIVFKKLLVFNKTEEAAEIVEEKATTKECPYCKSTIHIDAVKCPHCTSDVK